MKKLRYIVFLIVMNLWMNTLVVPAVVSNSLDYPPCFFMDFEDEQVSIGYSAEKVSCEHIIHGANNSLGAIRLTVTQNYGCPYQFIRMEPGQYKISSWIKLESGLGDNAEMSYIIYFPSLEEPDSNTYAQIRLSDTGLKVGEWVYVEANYTFTGEAIRRWSATEGNVWQPCSNLGRVEIRMGNGIIADEPVVYCLDDFSVVPLPQDTDIRNGDFERGEENWSGTVNTELSIVSEEGNQYGRVVATSKFNALKYTTEINIDFNKLYQITFDYRLEAPSDGYDTNDVFQLMLDRTSNQTDSAISDAGNIRQARYVTFQFPAAQQDWQTAKVFYKHSAVTLQGSKADLLFRIGKDLSGQAIYHIDNISIEEIGGSNLIADTQDSSAYEDAVAPIQVEGFGTVVEEIRYDCTDGEYWTAHLAQMETVGDKLRVTPTQPSGLISQGVAILPDREYSISFWARSDSGGNLEVALDRQRPDSNFGKEVLKEIHGHDTLSSDWQKFSYQYRYDGGFYGYMMPLLQISSDGVPYEIKMIQVETANQPVIAEASYQDKGEEISVLFCGEYERVIAQVLRNEGDAFASVATFTTAFNEIKYRPTVFDNDKTLIFELYPVNRAGFVGKKVSLTTDPVSLERYFSACNFEDDTDGLFRHNVGGAVLSAEQTGYSSRALMVNVTGDGGSCFTNLTMVNGQSYSVLLRIKLKRPVKNPNISLFIRHENGDVYTIPLEEATASDEDWKKIESDFTYEGSTGRVLAGIIIGSGCVEEEAGIYYLSYYLDDFVIYPQIAANQIATEDKNGIVAASFPKGKRLSYMVFSNEDEDLLLEETGMVSNGKVVYYASGEDAGRVIRIEAFSEDGDRYTAVSQPLEFDYIFNSTVVADDKPEGRVTGIIDYSAEKKRIDAKVYLAEYDGTGRLKGVYLNPFITRQGGKGTVKISGAKTDEMKTEWKLFLLDKETLAPLFRAVSMPVVEKYIYVDGTNGSDCADGSQNAPIKTLEHSLEIVKEKIAEGYRDIFVVLAEGDYVLESPLRFEADLYPDRQITVMAEDGKTVTVSGGRQITDWSLYDAEKDIYRAYAGEGLIFRQLYVDGMRGIRARSEQSLPFTKEVSFGHTISADLLPDFQYPADLEFVYHKAWSNARCGVDTIQKTGDMASVIMKQPMWENLTGEARYETIRVDEVSYIENAYELLDQPGEWYYNTHDGYVYYKPENGKTPDESEVVMPMLDKLVELEGAYDTPVENITFRNIQFQYAGWNKPTLDGGHADNQNNGVTYGDLLIEGAFWGKNVKNIRIEGCSFAHMGAIAIKLTGAVQNVVIDGCDIYDISGNGIAIGAPLSAYTYVKNPAYEQYAIRNVQITNNYIHQIGREYQSSCGISAAYTKDLLIAHNEIFDVPYSGMHLGYFADDVSGTEGTMVEYNFVHNVLNSPLYDGGAIYTLGATSGSNQHRNIVRYNYIADVRNGFGALYPDLYSNYWEFTGNVCDMSAVPYWDDLFGERVEARWLHVHSSIIKDNIFRDNYATTQNSLFKGGNSIYEAPVLYNPEAPSQSVTYIIDNAGILPKYCLGSKS